MSAALDRLRYRFLVEQGLKSPDVADLLNIATAAEASAIKAAAELQAVKAEREAARDIVFQAQWVVMSGLSGLLTDLTTADRDVYVSVLAGAGVEITYQDKDAADRTDELTFVGQTIGEAVALLSRISSGVFMTTNKVEDLAAAGLAVSVARVVLVSARAAQASARAAQAAARAAHAAARAAEIAANAADHNAAECVARAADASEKEST